MALIAVAAFRVATVDASERIFDLTRVKPGDLPPGLRSSLTGSGAAPDWKVVLDEVPSAMKALTPDAVSVSRRPVLAQLSADSTDERFPLLIVDDEQFADFTFTVRFKIVSGRQEQMAGVAFRLVDEKNYYVVRASALGRNVRFYKFVNGVRSSPIGPDLEVSAGVWHTLAVRCQGNEIHCELNGKEIMPTLTDNSFTQGKLALWTKSDSVVHFGDLQVDYKPLEPLAVTLVREAIAKYSRLKRLTVFASSARRPEIHVVASSDPSMVGKPGGKIEQEVIAKNGLAYGQKKKEDTVIVTLPMHDRNGDAVAAVRLEMESFPGQTKENAVVRATPVVKHMEARVRSAADLTQ